MKNLSAAKLTIIIFTAKGHTDTTAGMPVVKAVAGHLYRKAFTAIRENTGGKQKKGPTILQKRFYPNAKKVGGKSGKGTTTIIATRDEGPPVLVSIFIKV